MKFARRGTVKKGRGVDMSPLVDCMMLLLIFYMLFTKFTQKEQQLEVKFPMLGGVVAEDTDVTIRIPIRVIKKDRILVENKYYTADGLAAFLHKFAAIGTGDVVFIISGEKTAKYQDIVDALNCCAMAGIDKVAFAIKE